MSEYNLVFHCAPTLAGIKSGSLYTSDYSHKSQVVSELQELNRRLGPKGMRVLPLKYMEKKVLIYVYRPLGLAKDLKKRDAREVLARAGYRDAEPEENLMELMERMNSSGDFPHEIGLFLGYPPEDVLGFMEKGGREAKCVGTWTVYGDEEAAKRSFSRYRRCTQLYCRLYSEGRRSLEQLAAAAGESFF